MKNQKDLGVKATVVVRLEDSDGEQTIVLYRGGKTGLAFRSPSHRVLKEAARQRGGGDAAATSGAPASAAMTHQQGGL